MTLLTVERRTDSRNRAAGVVERTPEHGHRERENEHIDFPESEMAGEEQHAPVRMTEAVLSSTRAIICPGVIVLNLSNTMSRRPKKPANGHQVCYISPTS
jgi:hypothetical protein